MTNVVGYDHVGMLLDKKHLEWNAQIIEFVLQTQAVTATLGRDNIYVHENHLLYAKSKLNAPDFSIPSPSMLAKPLAAKPALDLQGSEAVVSSLLVVKHVDDHPLAIELQGIGANTVPRLGFIDGVLFLCRMLVSPGVFDSHFVHPAFLAVGQDHGTDRLAVMAEGSLLGYDSKRIGPQHRLWIPLNGEAWGHG